MRLSSAMQAPSVNTPDNMAQSFLGFEDHPDLFLQCGTAQFGVNEAFLTSRAPLFARMLAELRADVRPDLGRTRESAMILNNIKARAMADYLDLAYTSQDHPELMPNFQERESCDSLCAILEVAVRLGDLCARAYTVQRLHINPDLDDVHRVWLGVTYFLEDWGVSAFGRLLCKPMRTFTPEDLKVTPPEVMSRIIAIKHDIIDSRISSVFKAPVSAQCVDCPRVYCHAKWCLAWQELCVPFLRETIDEPLMQSDFEDVQAVLTRHHPVCDACLQANLVTVRREFAAQNAIAAFAVEDWRASVGFGHAEALQKAIQRRSQHDPLEQSGWFPVANLELLAHFADMGTLQM